MIIWGKRKEQLLSLIIVIYRGVNKAGRKDGIMATRRKEKKVNNWLVFFIIAFSLFMMTMNATIVATALHTLQHDLGTTLSWVGWTLTAYSFGFVIMLPLSAKLSIQYGHRRIFIYSVAVFTIASFFCGLAENIYILIIIRVFQAMGGAGITPSATGLIVEYFGRERDKFLGLFGSIFAIGAMVGPIFGGLFVTYWSWPWIFFINVPIGIAAIILALRFIPRDKNKWKQSKKMDFIGLGYLGVAIMTAMYAATYLSQEAAGVKSPLFIGLIVVSIISFILLFRHLNSVEYPFIEPRFITGKGFAAVNIVNIVYTGIVIGAISLVPLYAINRYGISELSSGTLLVAEGIASVSLSIIMSMRIRQTGYRLPIYVGSTILALGIGLMALNPILGMSPYAWLAICAFMIGLGFGIMGPAGRNAGIQLAPEQSAHIAAVRSLGIQLGQIVTIAVATAIITDAKNHSFAQAIVYVGIAVILFCILPIISRVPEQKGAWEF